MKKLVILCALIAMLLPLRTNAQMADSADVFIITCAPGTESYSIYGHTALRITIRGTTFDRVYNWGIFDFSTPNFTYRFAKGRLDYMLGAYSYEDFLMEYIADERAVWSQKLNLTTAEKERLFALIDENLQPENVRYRYDFFFDNCATRVRDIVAKAATDTVIFPERERKQQKSFRQLVDPNQKVLPWLDLGADMLLGLQADKKATPSDEMFLPVHLMNNMLNTVIVHNNVQEPLTGPAEVVVDIPAPGAPGIKTLVPQGVFYLLLIVVLLITFVFGKPRLEKVTDIVLYFIYSVVAILLLFTNIFSEHDALHFNLLFLGINLLIPVLFPFIIIGRKAVIVSRIAFFISALWLPVSLIAGQGINPAVIPLVLIIMVRLFRHCEFGGKL
jgi:hypothetical protein